MIDFRYHVVSLISVFLALAVGIALGAGPLKESIGAQLTGQVEQLRSEKSELREQLDAERAESNLQRAFTLATADDLLGDLLKDRNVAIITTPGVEKEDVDGVGERVETAGAKITARFDILDSWTSPSQRSFRSSLVSSLHDYLDPVPDDSASVEEQLAVALGQMLTSHAPSDALTLSENSSTLQELLVSADLITPVSAHTAPADLILVIVPTTVEDDESDDRETLDAFNSSIAQLGVTLADTAEGVVVAGSALESEDVIFTLRKEHAAIVTTVDGVDHLTGQMTAVLALADAVVDPGNAFGSRVSADLVAPVRADLPEPDRSLPDLDDPDAGEESGDLDGSGETDEAEGDAAAGEDDGVDVEQTSAEEQ